MLSNKKIDISTGTIIRFILVLLLFWLVYMILDILALLFVAIIIVSAMEPAVDWLQGKKVPRTLGVIIIYLITLGLIILFVSFLIPPIAEQVKELSQETSYSLDQTENSFFPLKDFLSKYNINLELQQLFGQFGKAIASISQNIFSTTIGVFSGFVSAIVVLSLAFYMSVEENSIKHFVVSITPEKHKSYVGNVTDRIKDSIGKWMLGQLMLMLIIAVLVWLGLMLVGVPHALLLGVFAGIMEIVPYIGPIIGAVPGVILAFMVSPTAGLLTIGIYILTQQLENHIIVPQVMKKAVGLNPIAIILVLLIGAKLAGVMGAILAVPMAAALSIFVKDLRAGKEI